MSGFPAWLSQYAQVKGAIGDLARDAVADPQWPAEPDELQTWVDYLALEHGLDDDAPALRTLREAWKLYQR